MKRYWLGFALSTLTLFGAGQASASGCCYLEPRWKLNHTEYSGDNNSAMLSPGNDSRVNLMLLLADKRGVGSLKLLPPPNTPDSRKRFPQPLFWWQTFRTSLDPNMKAPDYTYSGDAAVCENSNVAISAFSAAVNSERTLRDFEKLLLIKLRTSGAVGCDGAEAESPTNLDVATLGLSNAAKPFAEYMRGARDFYGASFESALQHFASLSKTQNAWLKEASLYMVARAKLNQVQSLSADSWGDIDGAKVDKKLTAETEAAFLDYLRKYPKGRYSTSARGLLRRVFWLSGEKTKLGGTYQLMFDMNEAVQRGISDFELVQEVDNKLLPGLTPADTSDPVILATIDLMRLRYPQREEAYPGEFSNRDGEMPITLAELEAQRPKFAQQKALFDFVLASHAFHVAHKPAEVLRLIPDAARQSDLSYLEFSRQMLRGLALDALKDANAGGFWQQLSAGAAQPYQREALALAFAMHEERSGGLARIFANDSVIRDPFVREIVLSYTAGPALLRQQATNTRSPQQEREVAMFALLYKQLSRGQYADFLADVARVRANAPADQSYMSYLTYRELGDEQRVEPPIGLFAAASISSPFGCPSVAQTARELTVSPRAARAQLCLAEFFRVNGFDEFPLDTPRPKDQLGGAPSEFPGKPYSRQTIYQGIIADPKAGATEKAYALYRAVRCYAPAGNNDCGGTDVEPPQRAAWYRQLKRDYPSSRWAQTLEAYW